MPRHPTASGNSTSSEDTTVDTNRARDARTRQATALQLRAQGRSLDYIAAKCGYTHRSAARKALLAARREIAEDTAEEERLNFKASYAPIRVALHRLARRGNMEAVEALVKLDERECRLFGLDLDPSDAMIAAHYTKRIVIEERPLALPAPTAESERIA